MSAVNIPNRNFDNEKQTHTPYSEIVKAQLKSSYENFRSPKTLSSSKKTKKQRFVEDSPRVDPTAYRKWFAK